jgi:hypothetical protein
MSGSSPMFFSLSKQIASNLYGDLGLVGGSENIRLLELQWVPDGSTTPSNHGYLRGSLNVVSLSSKLRYTALSYVW